MEREVAKKTEQNVKSNEESSKNPEDFRKKVVDKTVFNPHDLHDSVAKFEVYRELKNKIINNINLRRRHFTITYRTLLRIQTYLRGQVEDCLQTFKGKSAGVDSSLALTVSVYNHQLGLANHELRSLGQTLDDVIILKGIFSQQEHLHFSQGLFKVLHED